MPCRHAPRKQAGVPAPTLPLIAILDASVAPTGAFVAATRMAINLRDQARFLLILPVESQVQPERLPPNMELVRLSLPVLKKSLHGLLSYPVGMLRAARQLRELLVRSRAIALIVNDFYLLPGPMVRLLGWSGRVITMVRIDSRRFGLPGRIWLEAAKRWSDRVLAVSRFVQRAAALPSDSVLYDPSPVAPAPKVHQRGPKIVFIGNYIVGKGQDAAVRAFHRLAVDFPEAELRFHGGDMGLAKNRLYKDALERAAAAGPAADRIRFFDFAQETGEVLDEARASLTLSHSESFSFTCQEASARGVPVIATRCGGPEEIVEDGVTGFLVAIDDDAAIAERMARLLSEPALAQSMGEAGSRLMAERFAVDTWRKRMIEVLGLAPADL